MSSFMRHISEIYHCAMLYRDAQLKSEGISGRDTPYLLTLYSCPGIAQEKLAEELSVNKSSVARHIAKLESEGFVRREPDMADKRVLRCYPTEKAVGCQEKIRSVHREWRLFLTSGLTDEEKQQLDDLCEKIACKAEEYVKGGGEK